MKIGLVRHFEVNHDIVDEKISSNEFNQWMDDYDKGSVNIKDVDLRGIDWNKCYSSDLSRAVMTAKTIFEGDIVESSLIREVPMRFSEVLEGKETVENWNVYSTFQWSIGSDKVVENINGSRNRVNKFLDELEKNSNDDDNILIVCHGMIMVILDEQLKNRGFKGERVVVSDNGELFLLEK